MTKNFQINELLCYRIYLILLVLHTEWNTFSGKCEQKKIGRIAWTQKQKEVMTDFFKAHIKNKHAPKKKEVEELRTKYVKLFENKNWIKIKAFVYNCYK